MHAFLVARYVALAFFGICCILVSVLAAWNITETQFPAAPATIVQVDTFLIVESILGMLVVFTVIPIELLSKTAVTSRVWFEVTWVALFFVLSISGAAASTATGPSLSCALSVRRPSLFKDACTSASVVQGFAWLCTVTLFFYLVAIVVSTLLSAANNARIWHTAVRDVAWFATSQQQLKSGPSSPTSRSFQEKQVPVYNVGIQPQAILYKQTTKETLPEKPSALATPAVQRTRASEVPTPKSLSDTPPLYPQLLPRLQTQAVAQRGSSQSASPSSDAPAPQSRAHSPSSSTSSSASSTSSTSPGGFKPLALQGSATPARPKPGSPKNKHRPPPLNLSGLSSFNSTGKRPDRAPRK
ncbi:hypothetical protein AURDEDRAFT_110858 [Auricularia subglabra TFB-10046 SS5]|nr:hypothetical protein AURDEDRAFT_110858 [Auricularia subglabra TFB-10046 SS5]